jgi:hypothetical protein
MIETINNWKPEVLGLIRTLERHGCVIVSGDNGEYRFKREDSTLAKFIEDLIACDEAHLHVTLPNGKRAWLYLVLGNSPGELVCDYSCPEGYEVLDKATEEHYTRWEGVKQPKITGEYRGGKFVPVRFRVGTGKRRYYPTLEKAQHAADEIYKKTGVIVSIEQV